MSLFSHIGQIPSTPSVMHEIKLIEKYVDISIFIGVNVTVANMQRAII
jgi:histidinol phosphatase-like PHP family hydrolase